MIKADPGFVAVFKNANNTHTEAVLAWDDQGHALVLDARRGQLVQARSLDGFRQVQQGDDPYLTAVPGQGWLVEATEPDGKVWTQPVIAFALDKDGCGVVVTGAGDGSVEAERLDGETRKLIPPGGWGDEQTATE